jgi:hypothetical protein
VRRRNRAQANNFLLEGIDNNQVSGAPISVHQPRSTSSRLSFAVATSPGCSALKTPIQLYDPLNLDANGRRVPFPNNRIPIERMDP